MLPETNHGGARFRSALAFYVKRRHKLPMATTRRPAKKRRKTSGFIGTGGYDLMGGPKVSTKPACPPKYLPQLGLDLGMDRRGP